MDLWTCGAMRTSEFQVRRSFCTSPDTFESKSPCLELKLTVFGHICSRLRILPGCDPVNAHTRTAALLQFATSCFSVFGTLHKLYTNPTKSWATGLPHFVFLRQKQKEERHASMEDSCMAISRTSKVVASADPGQLWLGWILYNLRQMTAHTPE